MKKFLSGLCASALAASFAVSSVVPVNAAPVFIPKVQSTQSDVIQVQGDGRFDGGNRRWRRGRDRDFDRSFRRGRDRDYGWYRGYRGYRNYRRGYRRHGEFWFPLAAFAAGALITGAINNNTRVYAGGNAHVNWCYNRYRSYRAYDNTFQPYNGPRRQCYSPYS